jgi:membrane-associated phospholipid phosphatase
MKTRATTTSLLLTIILFFSPFNSSSQQTDSSNKPAKKAFYFQAKKKNYLSAKSLIIPVSFIGYGFATLKSEELQEINKNIATEVQEDASDFKTKADNYLQYAPAAGVYLLNAAGIYGRNKIFDRTIILTMTTIVSTSMVTALKHVTHQLRPDGSTYNSFPSGHTTTAFIGAEMMNQEFGWRSPWYSVVGYTMATGTGALRIMNNRHWLSDVIAGAGIGILSTKFSYWLYGKWGNRKHPNQLVFY